MAKLTTSDGTAISYIDGGGDGRPVLLVHGITESAESWRRITDELRADHRVITMDLRGHGESGTAARYDLEAMAGDVVEVMQATDVVGDVHLVGHSLGGAVVSAVGAAAPVASVVSVDQSLQLGAFKAQLVEVEAMLRNEESFPAVIDGLFTELAGSALSPAEVDRLNVLRAPDQSVVLGVWELMFSMTEQEIEGVVAGALGGYASRSVPYLALSLEPTQAPNTPLGCRDSSTAPRSNSGPITAITHTLLIQIASWPVFDRSGASHQHLGLTQMLMALD